MNAQLYGPTGLFVSNDEVYFADCNNHRIRKLFNTGKIVTIAGNGELGYGGDNGHATNAKLNYPNSVFVSSSNEVYIADYHNHRIRKILESGIIVTVAGIGEGGFDGDGKLATESKLYYPVSVFESGGEVFVADYHNHRVRKIQKNGIIVTIAGTGQPGYSGDGMKAIDAMLNCPMGIFVNNDEVYIADSANQRIRKILKNGMIITVAGNGEQGFQGDGQLAIHAKLNCPIGSFVDSIGEIYITDCNNNRIRKVLQNGIILTIAGNGEDGFVGDGGLAINAQLNYPMDVFVTQKGEIYISDSNNHVIRKILTNGTISSIVGSGPYSYGYSGDQ